MSMTNQEAFDFVAKKLIEQGEPSINDSGMCLYRGPNNNRCAAGWLIPDDKYTDDMEGNTTDCDSHPTLRESINCNDLHFVSVLQTAHDNATKFSAAEAANYRGWRQVWKNRMYVIAGQFKLDYAVLEMKWCTL